MSSWTNATLAEYWKRNFPLRIDLLDILKVVAATAAAIFGLALLHRMLYRFLKNAAVRISQFFRRAPTKLGSGKGDPFAVLGLERGKEKTTIVDAVKARRKLALKYHPDRNLDNAEEATKKMQEINDAFNQVEHILTSGNCGDEDDETGSETDSDSEYENMQHRRRQSNNKKGSQPQQTQYHDEEAEFKRRMREEMKRFNKAQREAEAAYVDGSWAPGEDKENNAPNKSRSKAGKKRAAKKRAKRRKQQQKEKQKQQQRKCDAKDHSPPKHDPSPANDTPSSTSESIPLHHLAAEKRCEIKFGSSLLSKSPIFTAIREKAWTVLQMLILSRKKTLSDPIPSLEHDVSVTPLMIACYLGDNEAASAIIELSGNQWYEAVLAKTKQGEDCLDLAKEALGIAEKLYEEAKVQDEATTKKERAKQEKNIEQCKVKLEMATDLVDRIQSLKQFALDKKRKSNIELFVLGAILLGICYHYRSYFLTVALRILPSEEVLSFWFIIGLFVLRGFFGDELDEYLTDRLDRELGWVRW